MFERITMLSSSGSNVSKRIKMILFGLLDPDDEATQSFETLGTAQPTTQHRIPKD
jgi:hypothetical protein